MSNMARFWMHSMETVFDICAFTLKIVSFSLVETVSSPVVFAEIVLVDRIVDYILHVEIKMNI